MAKSNLDWQKAKPAARDAWEHCPVTAETNPKR
jgi:hypothetical protein